MTSKLLKNYHKVYKKKLDHKRIKSILKLVKEIISTTKSEVIPPINDHTPYFFYRTPKSDKSRNMLLVSLATWDCENQLQREMLDLVKPIRDFDLTNNKFPNNVDAYGKKPSSGKCSRYTFNVYPTDGYLNWHTDSCGEHFPYSSLFLLNDQKNHSLQIKYGEKNIQKIDSNICQIGDICTFYPSYLHRVNLDIKDIKFIKDPLEESCLDPFRVEGFYVNMSEDDTKKALLRQNYNNKNT